MPATTGLLEKTSFADNACTKPPRAVQMVPAPESDASPHSLGLLIARYTSGFEGTGRLSHGVSSIPRCGTAGRRPARRAGDDAVATTRVRRCRARCRLHRVRLWCP